MRILLLCVPLVAATPAHAQVSESLRTIESRPGVTQPFVVVESAGAPVASVILFPGGEGVVGFKGPGPFPRGGNFLVRNRKAFAAHGLLVAVIDVPSDHAGGSAASASPRTTPGTSPRSTWRRASGSAAPTGS